MPDYPDKWSPEKCVLDDGNTDAYGEIFFTGASKILSKVVITLVIINKKNIYIYIYTFKMLILKYMRLSFRTNMDTVIKLLMDKNKWNLKQPKLIISVTGGAKCVLQPRLKETFCKGLVKVATTTQSWVTSGGKNQVRLLLN